MGDRIPADASSLSEVAAVSEGVLCDILYPPPVTGLAEELAARHRTGYAFTSLSMSSDDNATPAQIYPYLARLRHQLELMPDIRIVDDVADIRQARRDGKLGVGFHFQGSEPVGRDLAHVGAYYKLGIRWMLMAYNFQNNVGTGCIEAEVRDGGLSAFGRELIAEMNRVGMIVDCSHSGHRTTMEAMEASTQPCIFSHSNARALFDHPRNIRDDQIRACAATGGVIGINGVGAFLGLSDTVPVAAVKRHIDYVAELVGPEHVCLGLDYMSPGYSKVLSDSYGGRALAKIGMPELPWAFFDPLSAPDLLAALLDGGYSAEQVRGIMGENFLRVADAVWR